MAKLTKRTVEALQPGPVEKIFWDDALKGFGVRVFPSGSRKFILKYRTATGQQRKLGLGAFPVVTVDAARETALKRLAEVAQGGDPAADKRDRRQAVTVADLCDAYFEACDAGLVLGRGGQPKRASTTYIDRGRVERHVKPLLGRMKAREVRRADIERFKSAVVTGKTAADVKTKTRGRAIVKGGKGTATRALGLLGAIFKWGLAHGHVEANPVAGVQRFADKQRKALLTAEQYRALGLALDTLEAKRDRHGQPLHHPFGLACIRLIALTGMRRGEAEGLRWAEVDLEGACVRLGVTKTGASVRPLGEAARTLLEGLPRHGDYVFPSAPANAPYAGLPRLWRHVQKAAAGQLDGLTPHSLRHSFAGTADLLDCSLPTIAALLGHRLAGVTAGYVHKRMDRTLVAAADRVAGHVDRAMAGTAPAGEVVPLLQAKPA